MGGEGRQGYLASYLYGPCWMQCKFGIQKQRQGGSLSAHKQEREIESETQGKSFSIPPLCTCSTHCKSMKRTIGQREGLGSYLCAPPLWTRSTQCKFMRMWYMYICIFKCICTYTHTCTQTQNMYICIHTPAHTHIYMYRYVHTHMIQTYLYLQGKWICASLRVCVYTHTGIQTRAIHHLHMQFSICTSARTHTHAHTHTYAHTHTRTHSLSLSRSLYHTLSHTHTGNWGKQKAVGHPQWSTHILSHTYSPTHTRTQAIDANKKQWGIGEVTTDSLPEEVLVRINPTNLAKRNVSQSRDKDGERDFSPQRERSREEQIQRKQVLLCTMGWFGSVGWMKL